MNALKAYGAIASAAASTLPAGSITVATITAPAPGIAGWLGMTATSTIAVPVAAPVVIGAGLCVGAWYASRLFRQGDDEIGAMAKLS